MYKKQRSIPGVLYPQIWYLHPGMMREESEHGVSLKVEIASSPTCGVREYPGGLRVSMFS